MDINHKSPLLLVLEIIRTFLNSICPRISRVALGSTLGCLVIGVPNPGVVGKDANGNYHANFCETYVVGGVTPEPQQYVAIFLPDPTLHPAPADGYPLHLMSLSGGFLTTPYGTVIPRFFTSSSDEVMPWRLLEEYGVAIGWMGSTGTFDALGGVLNTTSPGKGIFHPPGTPGWDDVTLYSAPKEAILAVQLCRYRQGVWGIDGERITVDGRSSGSVMMSAPLFWPDQADATKFDHRRMSSQVLGGRLLQWQADFRIYDPTATIPNNFSFWPDSNGDIYADLATTFADIPAGYLRWSSPLWMLDNDVDRARIAAKSLWIHNLAMGNNLASFGLAGAWAPSQGKAPLLNGTLDPSLPGALHELGPPVMFVKALREVDLSGYQSLFSRHIYDQVGYATMLAVEAGLDEQASYIREGGTFDYPTIDAELDWISWTLKRDTRGFELRWPSSSVSKSLTVTAEISHLSGPILARGVPLWHAGGGIYSGNFPRVPALPAGLYKATYWDSGVQVGSSVVNFAGIKP